MGVVKLADYRTQLEVVEHRVAELEDGYTRTANTLLEAAMLSGLTAHQLLIVMAVWRKTYGYNKKIDWIGNEQFAELTGMAPTKCSTAKNELIRMGVLIQVGRQVGMNTNISEWKTKVNGFGKTFTNSVIVVLALGRNAELRKQLAEATNPVAIGRLLERIESKARIMPKAKTTAATTPTVKGSNGAVINNLDKLKAKALETGDWTPYFAAKKAKK